MTSLFNLINGKKDIDECILIVIDQLTKMIYYTLVKVNIDILGLKKLIINMIIYYYDL